MTHYLLPILMLAMLILPGCKSSQSQQTEQPNPAPENKVSAQATTAEMPFNALSPQGEKGPLLRITAGGRSAYTIVLPDAALITEKTAATELQRWLQEMTGVQLPIQSERSFVGERQLISIGNTRLSRKYLPKVPDLGTQGYLIEGQEERLFLLGGTLRGPLNAVFALLEEDLGCRWYNRDEESTYIPRQAVLQFSPVNRSSIPVFESRELHYWESYQQDWFVRNRLNPSRPLRGEFPAQYGASVMYPLGWAQHTFFKLVPGEEYSQSHPEYYSEIGGQRRATPNGLGTQLCLTNSEVKQIATRKVLQVLKENPQARLISISQNDGGGLHCTCNQCSALDTKEGSKAGSLIHFVNHIADAVAKPYPEVKVVTLAYKSTAIPPKTVRPRDNVIVELTTDVYWGQKYLPIAGSAEFSSYLQGWQKLGAHIYLWDYSIVLRYFLLPLPNMAKVQADLRYYQQQKVSGIMFQGAYQSKGWGAADAPLRCWVWSKLMWDPQQDSKALIRDFNEGYYREAAAPMQAYSEYLWQIEQEHAAKGQESEVLDVFPADFSEKAKKFIARAHTLARSDEVKKRVEIAELSILYYRLLRGPLDKNDREAVRTDLKRFELLAQKHKLFRLQESDREGGIDNFVQQVQVDLQSDSRFINARGNVFRVDDQGFFLPPVWEKSDLPQVVKDPLASNQYALRQNGDVTGWRVQYKLKQGNLVPGKTYRLKIAFRYDKTDQPAKTGPKGEPLPAFDAGIFLPTEKSYFCKLRVNPEQLPEKRYQEFDFGTFEMQKEMIFYLTMIGNPAVKAVYIDYMDFILEP